MLYSIKKQIGSKEVNLVLFASLILDGMENIISFKQILSSDTLPATLNNVGDRVQVFVPEETNTHASVPFLIATEESVPSTEIYKFLSKKEFTDGELELIATKANSMMPSKPFNVEKLKSIYTLGKELENYCLGKDLFRVETPSLFLQGTDSIERLKLHNGRVGDKPSYMSSGLNVTNFMQTPEDLFYIKLPDYDKLSSDVFPVDYFTPSLNEIARPYPHPVYNTPYVLHALESPPTVVKNILKEIGTKVTLSAEQKVGFPKIDLGLLYGFPDNDMQEIQDNELEFRDALKELILFDIKSNFPGEDPEEKYKNGICSGKLYEYLKSLVNLAIYMNWNHNGKFPVDINNEISTEDLDEDDSAFVSDSGQSEDTTSVADKRTFMHTGGSSHFVDGFEVVHGFIFSATIQTSMGLDAMVEAIIKLFRWGKRKPSTLVLSGFNRYLDMNTLIVKSAINGFSNKIPTDYDGYSYSLLSTVFYDGKFRDSLMKEKWKTNVSGIANSVGLAINKWYEDDSFQTNFIGLLELVNWYVKEPSMKLIKGIEFNGDKFTVDLGQNTLDLIKENHFGLRQIKDIVSGSLDKEFVFFVTDDKKNMILNYSIKDISELQVLLESMSQENYLSNSLSRLESNSKKEFEEKVAQTGLPVQHIFKVNMAKEILYSYIKVAELLEDIPVEDQTLEVVLNTYLKITKQLNLTGLNFLEERESILEESSSFKTQEKEEVTVTKHSILMPLEDGERVNTLSLSSGKEDVIGFTVRKTGEKTVYIISSPSNFQNSIKNKSVTPNVILSLCFDTLYRLETGETDKIVAYFNSLEDLAYCQANAKEW